MQVSKKKIDENRTRFTVTLSTDEVNDWIKKGCISLAYQGKMTPTPDKTPKELVTEVLGEEAVQKFLDMFVMNQAAPFAISEKKVSTIGLPSFFSEDVAKEDNPFTFSMTVVIKPSYSLTSYEPVEITVPPFEVTPEEVDAYMAEKTKNSTYQDTDTSHDVVEKGDMLELSLKTEQDGKELPALTADARPYETGAFLMPDEFDEAIIGMKVGETKTFDFEGPTFEMDETGNPVMEKYTSTVTVKRLLRDVIPAVTDAWVEKNVPGCSTVVEYQEVLKKELEEQKALEYRHYKNFLAASELAKRLDAKIPDEVYEASRDELLQTLNMQMQQQGMTHEQFLQQQGMEEQQFSMMVMLQVREQLTQQLAMDALIRHENMQLEEGDYDAFFAVMAPGKEAQARKDFEQSGRVSVAQEGALRLKANEWLVAHATINEATPAK